MHSHQLFAGWFLFSLTRLSVQVMWLSTIATRLAWLEEILQSRLQSLHTFGCSIWFLGQP